MVKDTGSGMDNLLNKAEDALGKFMEDPEKVAKAKTKGEDVLSKHMSRDQAQEVMDSAEKILDTFAHHDHTRHSTD